MSKETVREFFEVAESDVTLQERMKAASSAVNVVQIANEKGYKFTDIELQSVMQEEVIAADGNLSEEELEFVAGGFKVKVKCKASTGVCDIE